MGDLLYVAVGDQTIGLSYVAVGEHSTDVVPHKLWTIQ